MLVYPHSMEIGGSQLNAIELGAAVRDLGHEVLVVSEPGPMVELVKSLGLKHRPIPLHRRRPSPEVIRVLIEQVRRNRIDVVHGYEWPPAVEALVGPRLRLGVPAVATVMSAAVAPFLPRGMPLVVGTEMLRRQVLADGYDDVTLIAPPVDLAANTPSFDPGDFRAVQGFRPDHVLLVICCRLVRELKLEGLLAACDAVGELVQEGFEVRLAIVGDGAARAEVARRAAQVNRLVGRTVVVLAGELADPRPAYAAADVVLGMGGSALRGMAFGKPLVVQGECGFWKACRPDTVAEFLVGGWYGRGRGGAAPAAVGVGAGRNDSAEGAARLKSELLPLLKNADHRAQLGEFSRALIVEHFSLATAAATQANIYRRVIAAPPRPRADDLARLTTSLTVYKVGRRIQRLRGRQAVDDFNALTAMRAGP